MAKVFGSAGKSSRGLAEDRRRKRKLALLIGAGAMLVALILDCWAMTHLPTTGSSAALFITFAVIAVFIGIMKTIDREVTATERLLKKRARDADRGARGEDRVGAVLDALPDTYYVFHDLSRLCGDIDHIVVGPTGVFTLETKAHGGQITAAGEAILVNGKSPEKDFIAQCWRNAFWVRDLLKNTAGIEAQVTPILVFAHATVRVGQVKGIRVTWPKRLPELLTAGPAADLPVERIAGLLAQKMGTPI